MSSLVVSITFSVLMASIYAQCNWVKENSIKPNQAVGVCTKTGSAYKKWICAEDGSNTVTVETYSDAACTSLTGTSTLSSSKTRSCGVTAGECQYAMMSLGCGSYDDYPIPTNLCVKEGTSSYYYLTCLSNGVSRKAATDSSCSSRISMSLPFNSCNTINGDQWKARYCGTVIYGPTVSPTTAQPTTGPSATPTTVQPSASPTTGAPTRVTVSPTTAQPTSDTGAPSNAPSAPPTTAEPTSAPTVARNPESNARPPSCVLFNFAFAIFVFVVVYV